MKVFSDVQALADYLQTRRQNKKLLNIGIDGKDGVGKTKLASELSRYIGIKVISLDDYIEKNQDRYVSALKLNKLSMAFKNVQGIIAIEGVCLLAATKHLGIELDEHIYIKRMNHGLWADEDVCCPKESADKIIEKEEADLLVFLEYEASGEGKDKPSEGDAGLSGLTKEIIRYHVEYMPSQIASCIFQVNHA